MSLSAVIEGHRLNARLAWAVVLGLTAVAAVDFALGDPVWAVFAAAGVVVAVSPAVRSRDATRMPPWEVLVVVLVPPLVQLVDVPAPLEEVTASVAVAALALVVVVELHVFSSVELTPTVAVALVVVTTTAAVGLWTILRFASDAFLGTGYIEGKVQLMWSIVFATAGGVLAGPLAFAYLRRHESVGRRGFDLGDGETGGADAVTDDEGDGGASATDDGAEMADESETDDGMETEEGTETDEDTGVGEVPNDGDGTGERSLVLAVRAMQLALVGLVLFGVATFRWGLVVNAGVALAVTFLPGVLEHNLALPMNAGLAAWITLAVFLHGVGAVGPYEWFGWYDSVTHTLSATVVAGAGYASARAVDLHYDRLTVPTAYMGAFIVVFVLAFGVVWEIMEFATGGVASVVGGEPVLAQYGSRDIVLDLVFNSLGAVLVAVLGTSRLRGVAGDLASRLGSRG
ncbi:hypothetical protein ACFPYI_08245 [Halomarina salina]|uniref:DUF2238 domain-containing protein n=1 Tax=Halomarina salina TaxID=1872699 RepID=A0ABD5RLE7_9EURY|nr:hypothetical protein [Halomarina salina]